ncbi:hypothetical protein RUND412_004684 [Rhizina undulata]
MTDLFDSLLTLEEDYYTEGYTLGLSDGEHAGRLEGRIFGLEKGFEKFLELGHLSGRCAVWKSRLPPPAPPCKATSDATDGKQEVKNGALISNPRAKKQIESLELVLINPPFSNSEEAVEEVEETVKRARGKAKVLEGMLGERESGGKGGGGGAGEESIEDATRGKTGVRF